MRPWLRARPGQVAGPDGPGKLERRLAQLGDRGPVARALLTALAWAREPGLPGGEIWAAMARALPPAGAAASLGITVSDTRWLPRVAGAWMERVSTPDGAGAYRLRDSLLAAALRGEPADPDAAAAADWRRCRERTEQAIVVALIATVPAGEDGPRWELAHPYVRGQLAAHAAATPDGLRALVQDWGFVAAAGPATLGPLLWTVLPWARDTVRAYRRARPFLGADPRANAAYLDEAMCVLTEPDAARAGVTPIYRTLLAAARRDDSVLVLGGHVGGAVEDLALGGDRDGRVLLATGTGDVEGAVRLWDPLAGTPIGEPLRGHEGGVWGVAFGERADGQLLLASGDAFGGVRIWDPLTGKAVGEPIAGLRGSVYMVALGTAPDGRLLLAACGKDEAVRIWDAETGAPVAALLGHTDRVDDCAFAGVAGEAGERRLLLATASMDQTVRVWDAVRGVPAGDPLTSPGGKVYAVALGAGPGDQGQTLLASGSEDAIIRIWDPITGEVLREIPAGNGRPAYLLAFGTAPGGRPVLASASDDALVRVWDPVTGEPFCEPLVGHTSRVWAVAFGHTRGDRAGGKGGGPGGGGWPLLASSAGDNTARVWDLFTGASPRPPRGGHITLVDALAFGTVTGAGGRRLLLASGGGDTLLRVWDPAAGAAVGEPLAGHRYAVRSVAFGTVTGEAETRCMLASGGEDQTVRLWDPVTGAPLRDPLRGHRAWVSAVVFGVTPEGRPLLVSASEDGTIQRWDPLAGTATGDPIAAHRGGVDTVAFAVTPDGRPLLASGGGDNLVRLWNPVTGAPVGEPLAGHEGRVRSVAFRRVAGDRLLVASGGDDQTIRLWDAVSGTPAGGPLTGHDRWVAAICFGTGADGRPFLASGGGDKTVRVWDPVRLTCARTLPRPAPVRSLAAAGQALAIGDDDGLAVIEFTGWASRAADDLLLCHGPDACLNSWNRPRRMARFRGHRLGLRDGQDVPRRRAARGGGRLRRVDARQAARPGVATAR